MNRTDPLQVGMAIVGATLLVGTVIGRLVVMLIQNAYFSF
jgi:hypothetical protein